MSRPAMTREQRLEQALHRIAEYWNGNANTFAMLDACKVTRDTAWQALAEQKAPDAPSPQPASDVVAEMRDLADYGGPIAYASVRKDLKRFANILQSCQDELRQCRLAQVAENEQNTALRGKLHVTQAKLEAAERRVAELESQLEATEQCRTEFQSRFGEQLIRIRDLESQLKPAKVDWEEMGRLLARELYSCGPVTWPRDHVRATKAVIAAYERSRATEGNDGD